MIRIGDEIEIVVKEIRRNQVRIGIVAPREIPIYRDEVYEAMKAAEEAAELAKREAVLEHVQAHADVVTHTDAVD